MKRDIPKEFLEKYESKRHDLQSALEQITSLLELRLSQLSARTGVRGRLADGRVKRPVKLWKNATKAGFTVVDAFTRIEDIIGIRIVCNNLSDIDPIVNMIRTDCSILHWIETKNMVSSPSKIGYRATHVRTKFAAILTKEEDQFPCEIQIRTFAQDTWARLSRADLYGKNIPYSIRRLAQALSTQLSTIDEIAQLIRDELNQCPPVAKKIQDSDYLSPDKLALLYKGKFNEDMYEWSLINWVRYLDEAEIETIGDVRALIDDNKMRSTLDRIANRIRGFHLEDLEWAVYSALIATEISTVSGIQEVKRQIQNSWDEIVTIARGEALSGMPDTLEEFTEMLQSGSVPSEALGELGGIQSCKCCGASILSPEVAADAVLDFYDKQDTDIDLQSLFDQLSDSDIPEIESVDFSGYCQYCGYQMSKDD